MVKMAPNSPGVYLFKDANDTIIYVGKAKSLRNRVKSYFQKTSGDWKIDALRAEYADIDYIITKTEHEAMLLEVKLIQDYQPKYNVLLKDGQPYLYILITEEPLPKIALVRNKNKAGIYFGPFLQKIPVRKVYQFLVTTFRLYVCNKKLKHGCLDYHLGRCAGMCTGSFDLSDYTFRLQLALDVLRGDHQAYCDKLKAQIEYYSQELLFEKAKHLHDYLENLDTIFCTLQTQLLPACESTIGKAGIEGKRTPCIDTLHQFLHLENPIEIIDCFDISHFQSTFLVGSCVRFIGKRPQKDKCRRFRIRTIEKQNDYAALQEIVSRRYKHGDLPDLVLIDGGKGQLHAIESLRLPVHCVSLAKKEEILFSNKFPNGVPLDVKTSVGQCLIAVRDYAHHFALTYHRKRRNKEGFERRS